MSQTQTTSRHANWLEVLVMLLSCVSWYVLFRGMCSLMSGAILIPLVVSAALVSAYVIAIHALKNANLWNGPFRRLIHIPIPLAAAIISGFMIIGFSSSKWYTMIQAENSARGLFSAKTKEVSTTIAALSSKYQTLESSFKTLAAHSRRMADVEEKQGNTCGIPSAVGNGPIRRFRISDSHVFGSQYEEVRQQAQVIEQKTARLQATKLDLGKVQEAEADLKKFSEEVNAGLINNPMLDAWKGFALSRQQAASKVVINGKPAQCGDDYRASQLDGVLEAIAEIKQQRPIILGALLDPRDEHNLTYLAFNRLIGIMHWVATMGGAGLAGHDPVLASSQEPAGNSVGYLHPEYWPLFLAAMIEVVLILLVMLAPAKASDEEWSQQVRKTFAGEAKLNPEHFRYLTWLFMTVPVARETKAIGDDSGPWFSGKFVRLREYLFHYGKRHYLVIPALRQFASIEDLAHQLVLRRHAKIWKMEEPAERLLSPSWCKHLETQGDKYNCTIDSANVFEVSAAFFEWLTNYADSHPPLTMVSRECAQIL